MGAEAKAGMAPVSAPDEVEGFIVALPTNWTGRENNLSINDYIAALAGIGNLPPNPFDPAPQNHQASVGAAGGT